MAAHKYERRWWKNGHWNYLYPYDRTGEAIANTRRPQPESNTTGGSKKIIPKGPSASEIESRRRDLLEAKAQAYGKESGKYTALGNKIDVANNPIISGLAARKVTKDFFERMASRKIVLSSLGSGNIEADNGTFSHVKRKETLNGNENTSMRKHAIVEKQLSDIVGAKTIADKIIEKLEHRAAQSDSWLSVRKPVDGREGRSGSFGRPNKYAETR